MLLLGYLGPWGNQRKQGLRRVTRLTRGNKGEQGVTREIRGKKG